MNEGEYAQDWTKEYRIGIAFVREGDYYRAITTFKRALVLLSDENENRRDEIEYAIVLSYYLAQKYPEVIRSFENGHLVYAHSNFVAYHDLLIILYDSYEKNDKLDRANQIKQIIEHTSPEEAKDLFLASAIAGGKAEMVEELGSKIENGEYIQILMQGYSRKKKSIEKAQTFSALLPGSGYAYIGQPKSAITSFLLNGLFITAATQFFLNHYYAAGAFTTALEIGWYVGGIYGAGEGARHYNNVLYSKYGQKIMSQEKMLFRLGN